MPAYGTPAPLDRRDRRDQRDRRDRLPPGEAPIPRAWIALGLVAVDAIVAAAALIVLDVTHHDRTSRDGWSRAHSVGPGTAGAAAQARQAATDHHADLSDFRITLAAFGTAVLVFGLLALAVGRSWRLEGVARGQWAFTVVALLVFGVVSLQQRPVPVSVPTPAPTTTGHHVLTCSGGSCPPGVLGG